MVASLQCGMAPGTLSSGLTRRLNRFRFLSTRERRMIQPMKSDFPSCMVREVTEA